LAGPVTHGSALLTPRANATASGARPAVLRRAQYSKQAASTPLLPYPTPLPRPPEPSSSALHAAIAAARLAGSPVYRADWALIARKKKCICSQTIKIVNANDHQQTQGGIDMSVAAPSRRTHLISVIASLAEALGHSGQIVHIAPGPGKRQLVGRQGELLQDELTPGEGGGALAE
jgi:hypothetical protein